MGVGTNVRERAELGILSLVKKPLSNQVHLQIPCSIS